MLEKRNIARSFVSSSCTSCLRKPWPSRCQHLQCAQFVHVCHWQDNRCIEHSTRRSRIRERCSRENSSAPWENGEGSRDDVYFSVSANSQNFNIMDEDLMDCSEGLPFGQNNMQWQLPKSKHCNSVSRLLFKLIAVHNPCCCLYKLQTDSASDYHMTSYHSLSAR